MNLKSKLKNSSAKYLIRMDDACPTLKSSNWDYLESLFDDLNIKPIVAVIPDNVDESLFLIKTILYFGIGLDLGKKKDGLLGFMDINMTCIQLIVNKSYQSIIEVNLVDYHMRSKLQKLEMATIS